MFCLTFEVYSNKALSGIILAVRIVPSGLKADASLPHHSKDPFHEDLLTLLQEI
jgi:hypothetical protein